MQQETAASMLQIALAVRVFGPDAVRCCRRLLAAGVRVGIAYMNVPPRHSSGEPDDHLGVEQ
ncbi:hypothetical protein ACFXKW_38495 [Streptomyces sp. NPDC059193]|uniref:hypothetical protein n=1 Tax=Streptomyces sp. NPDC059193 TaxID=3346763 RepID=UPI003686E130